MSKSIIIRIHADLHHFSQTTVTVKHIHKLKFEFQPVLVLAIPNFKRDLNVLGLFTNTALPSNSLTYLYLESIDLIKHFLLDLLWFIYVLFLRPCFVYVW